MNRNRRTTSRAAYADAIGRLFSLESRGIRMGVRRMADALAYRGHPERGLPLIHIAGTNGKGSVSTMVASGLRAAGYRTGLFTSPHLHRWVERIAIDGRPISEHEAARRIGEVLGAFDAPGAPDATFFELTTLMAIEAFAEHGCDIAVMEVGLGGRLDATNATTPLATVITRVALDHTRLLGDSLAAIATEKAGIIKTGVPVVSGVTDVEPRRVIHRRAAARRAPLLASGRDFRVVDCGKRFAVESKLGTLPMLRLGLDGAHQRDNAACAVVAMQLLRDAGFERLTDAAITRGLGRARWPARMERVRGTPDVLFDAAHNVDGCIALAAHLAALPKRGRRVLVFGAMADKDFAGMLAVLGPHFDRVLYRPPPMPRAATTAQLQGAHRGVGTRGTGDALYRARRAAGDDGLVVVAGSLFLIADARARVLSLPSDPLIRM